MTIGSDCVYIFCSVVVHSLLLSQGNNDHFPKNVFWPPYIKRLGDMFLETGFFTSEQHAQFIVHGCNYIDIDNVR